jgi:hypothetical protein
VSVTTTCLRASPPLLTTVKSRSTAPLPVFPSGARTAASAALSASRPFTSFLTISTLGFLGRALYGFSPVTPFAEIEPVPVTLAVSVW